MFSSKKQVEIIYFKFVNKGKKLDPLPPILDSFIQLTKTNQHYMNLFGMQTVVMTIRNINTRVKKMVAYPHVWGPTWGK